MSRPASNRPPPTPIPGIRSRSRTTPRAPTRRPSNSGLAIAGSINPVSAGAPKVQRTSKTQQKLVFLPTAPQTKPLPEEDEGELLHHGFETDTGVRDIKSEGERMNKEQRKKAGYKRITAYCVAEGFKMKVMSSFFKREHNVQPRMFDEAMYVMYHLPLLPGYGPNSNIRSSVPTSSDSEEPPIPVSEAEDSGYITSLPAQADVYTPDIDITYRNLPVRINWVNGKLTNLPRSFSSRMVLSSSLASRRSKSKLFWMTSRARGSCAAP
ncbi:hypothetical protein QCA50_018934 [Cerrena zonata]|uniref:Uncharacterized protein n=1 Tax=Cerrena zonata TaxID=2478898 RepID=A0AAW0FCK9_9APHY